MAVPCPTCGRPMRPLFTSVVCDWCDGVEDIEFDRAFIVWNERRLRERRPCHVFRTRTDAARWRAANRLQGQPIVEVRSVTPIRWRRTVGRIDGLEIGDQLFEIYRDHRFPPGPHRAYLAPDAAEAARRALAR